VDPLPEAIRVADVLQDMRLIREAIQERCGHPLIAKNGIPLAKAQVRGQHYGDPFMQLRTQLAEGLTALLGKRYETQFIQDEQIQAKKLGNEALVAQLLGRE
jgi:hypothetical protein